MAKNLMAILGMGKSSSGHLADCWQPSVDVASALDSL